MKAVKINITIEETVWQELSEMVPPRKKSFFINQLLKREISRIGLEREERELGLAFMEAAGDKDRLRSINYWETTDVEGWE